VPLSNIKEAGPKKLYVKKQIIKKRPPVGTSITKVATPEVTKGVRYSKDANDKSAQLPLTDPELDSMTPVEMTYKQIRITGASHLRCKHILCYDLKLMTIPSESMQG